MHDTAGDTMSVPAVPALPPLCNHFAADEAVSALSAEWLGSIPFLICVVCNELDPATEELPAHEFVTDNICRYLGGGMCPARRIYFCPRTYPPPVSVQEMDASHKTVHPGFADLCRDLEVEALTAVNPICSNGRGEETEGTGVFQCSCWRPRVRSPVNASLLRSTSLIDDRHNCRKSGQPLPHRSKVRNTSRLCNFRFRISWDHLGFFVDLLNRAGEGHHRFHPRPSDPSSMPFPSRLLTQQERQSVRNITQSSCITTARNYVFKTFGKFVNNVRLAYLDRNTVDGSLLTDDVTRMLADFENSRSVKFTTVSDVPLSELSSNQSHSENGTVTLSTTKTAGGTIVNTPVADIPKLSHLADIARHARTTRKLNPSQYLFMAIAWTMLPCLRYFLLCPEVLWFDVTSHSNNKGFCLLTFSCRTSLNKQVVFMWIWIPNEQRMSFRWVFQHALSTLLPEHVRCRVLMIMKDGDMQQRNEIMLALSDLFPNAREAGCGWHIGEIWQC